MSVPQDTEQCGQCLGEALQCRFEVKSHTGWAISPGGQVTPGQETGSRGSGAGP